MGFVSFIKNGEWIMDNGENNPGSFSNDQFPILNFQQNDE